MNKTLIALTAPIVLAAAVAAGGVVALEQHYLKETRAQATAKLRDPDGALFRNLRVIAHDREIFDVPDWTSCGEMNARNGLGGYEGYRPFYGGPFGVHHVETPDDKILHAQACGNGATWPQRLGHAVRAAGHWWRGG